jgi:hypothetical protein
MRGVYARFGFVVLFVAALLAGCGGGERTGSFIDQNGFQIGNPPGPSPSQATRDRVQEILRGVVPSGSQAPTQRSYAFDGGYAVDAVWKAGVTGSSGRITGPDPGLPAIYQVGAAGTAVQYTDFTFNYVPR